jgi:uridine kinase
MPFSIRSSIMVSPILLPYITFGNLTFARIDMITYDKLFKYVDVMSTDPNEKQEYNDVRACLCSLFKKVLKDIRKNI